MHAESALLILKANQTQLKCLVFQVRHPPAPSRHDEIGTDPRKRAGVVLFGGSLSWGIGVKRMSRSKKTKNRASRVPPLSVLDRAIYMLCIVLAFVLFILFFVLGHFLELAIARSDPSVIASTRHMSSLWALPFFFYIFMSVVIAGFMTFGAKLPIFGNPKVAYGSYPWKKDLYPLLDPRRKNVFVSEDTRMLRRDLRILWGIGLFITLILASLSFCGRDCLCRDDWIVSYDMFNTLSDRVYDTSDFHSAAFQTFVGSFSSKNYGYAMTIEMDDGRRFRFNRDDFLGEAGKRKDTLTLLKMREIKSLLPPERIAISGEERGNRVADYWHMNKTETELLRELFETASG